MQPWIFEVVKIGGVVLGVGITLAFIFFATRLMIPVLRALQPTNGRPDSGGPIFMMLQDLASLPVEVKNLTKTIEDHVFTKADVMEEMRKNRHDITNQITAPIASMTVEVRAGFDKIREEMRKTPDRRKKPRKPNGRRKTDGR